ncbi:MAG TPA: DUF1232 domain-containing protein [Clostridium sp.]
MKISRVQAQLTGEDILSIINEFVNVKGLRVDEISIDKEIIIKGNFTHGISLDFEGALSLEGVKDGKIYGRFSRLNIMKLGAFRMIRSFALKKALKFLEGNGVEVNKDRLIVDLNKILAENHFVSLDLSGAYIKEGFLYAEVEEINISINGQLTKEKIEEPAEVDIIVAPPIKKTEDSYTNGRKILLDKLPKGAKLAKDIIFIIPDIIALFIRMLKDARVPIKTKLALAASLAYIISPIDIIPDNIPLIGSIDDVAVILFALNRIATDVNITVIMENWQGNNEVLITLKSGLNYLMDFTGARNVEKIYSLIEGLSTL